MTERGGPERETDTVSETDYQVALASFKTSGQVIHLESQQKKIPHLQIVLVLFGRVSTSEISAATQTQ